MKRVWVKPKLVVLFRGKPEEFVLANCKSPSVVSSSSTYNPMCYFSFGGCNACAVPGAT